MTTTTIGSINVNFGRKRRTQRAEINDLLQDCDVVAGQELRLGLRHPFSEDVFTKRVKVFSKGWRLGSTNRLRQAIRFRRHRWKTVRFDGIGKVRVVSVHFPPRRMQNTQLDERYDASLHKVIRNAKRKGHYYLIAGDWNETRQEDPANLHRDFGVEWRGAHIDLFGIDPDLVPFVKKVRVGPKRWDGHQVIYLTLS